jgi:hypothetical protein
MPQQLIQGHSPNLTVKKRIFVGKLTISRVANYLKSRTDYTTIIMPVNAKQENDELNPA